MARRTVDHTKPRPENWREIYLEDLAKHGIKIQAAMKANVSRNLIDREIERDPEFAQACLDAFNSSTARLEKIAVDRAEKISDRLLIFLLQSRRPEVYGRRGTVTVQAEVNQTTTHIGKGMEIDQLAEVLTILQQAGALPDPDKNEGSDSLETPDPSNL